MTIPQPAQAKAPKPLRIWPGVVAVAIQWLTWVAVLLIAPEAIFVAMLVGVICGGLVLLWWLFFSRAPWLERLGAIALMVVGVIVTKRLVHPSIANGMMGMMLPVFSIPVFSIALVVAVVLSRRLVAIPRRVLILGAILVACVAFMLMRTGGITGDAKADLHWRWSKTPEERLLAQSKDDANGSAPISASDPADLTGWPGFRGPRRDGTVRGVRIDTDWTQKPPVQIWRQPIGPGWSSFAVLDDAVFTQEQRGENELVSCYNLKSGQAIWRHRDAARFWESNAGAGPRGTPTLSNGRVYTFGATGILNALDARNGAVVWSRNAATDTKTKTPGWGFASSPLVVGDVVIVATSGALAAYDTATGNPKWFGPTGSSGYSSPQLLTIDGVSQVLLVNGEGALSVSPTDGSILWKYAWPGDGIVQPAITSDGDVLVGSGSGLNSGVGLLRIGLKHESSAWTTKERWLSSELNPYFNDFVVHKDYAYGFDGSKLTCIDLKDGELKWKGGRYGHGQLLLLPDQDLLLIVSETGELALAKATPDQYGELARFKAIEGKTWNHPVLVGDVLLVRNGEEMAAFKLTAAR